MGYDMNWRVRPPEMEDAAADATRIFYEKIAIRDALPDEERGKALTTDAMFNDDVSIDQWEGRTQRYHDAQLAVHAAHEAMFKAQGYYFQLNIWGMGRCRDLMYDFDMAYPSEPDGDFPDYDGKLDDEQDRLETENVPREQWPAEVLAYAEEHEAYRTSGMQERPGIAMHKFGSNDGWIVTPIECAGAVEQWKRYCLDHDLPLTHLPVDEKGEVEWWPGWLAFLAGAIDHGGFRVY